MWQKIKAALAATWRFMRNVAQAIAYGLKSISNGIGSWVRNFRLPTTRLASLPNSVKLGIASALAIFIMWLNVSPEKSSEGLWWMILLIWSPVILVVAVLLLWLFVWLVYQSALALWRWIKQRRSNDEPKATPAAKAEKSASKWSGPPLGMQVLVWGFLLWTLVAALALFIWPVWSILVALAGVFLIYWVAWDPPGTQRRTNPGVGNLMLKAFLGTIAIFAFVIVTGMWLGWHEKVTPTVANKVNPWINGATGSQLPTAPPVDDAFVTATRPPHHIDPNRQGWYFITFTAEKGWVDSGLDIRPGQTLEYEIIPTSYVLSTSKYKDVPIRPDGMIGDIGQFTPAQAMRSSNAPGWLKDLTLSEVISPRAPYGVLLFRYGGVRSPLVADRLSGQHTPRMLIRRERILLALNILQVDHSPFLTHSGMVTVKIRVR